MRDSFKVDGLRDESREGIQYIGQATRQPDGTWQCLAIIGGGLLCRVEVTLTPDPGLLADFQRLW